MCHPLALLTGVPLPSPACPLAATRWHSCPSQEPLAPATASFSRFLCPRLGLTAPSLLLCGSGLSLPEEVLWGCLGPCLAPLHFPKVWGAVCRERSFSTASQLFRSLVVRGCWGVSMPESLLWGGALWACSPPAPWHSFRTAPAPPCLRVCCTAEVTMSGSSFVRVASVQCGSCTSTPQGAPQMPPSPGRAVLALRLASSSTPVSWAQGKLAQGGLRHWPWWSGVGEGAPCSEHLKSCTVQTKAPLCFRGSTGTLVCGGQGGQV